MSTLRNFLLAERQARGWTQEQTARAVGITRQGYAAVEAGTSVPSTEVALRLGQVLGRSVESLFFLPESPRERVIARWAGGAGGAGRVNDAGAMAGTSGRGAAGAAAGTVGAGGAEVPIGQRVRLYRVGGELFARPVGDGDALGHPADGTTVAPLVGGSVEVALLADRPAEPVLAVAGCDPAMGLVTDVLRRERGMESVRVHAGSRAALAALAAGEVHVAGAHLRDPATGEFNEAAVRESVPFPCTRVSFAWWEQGLFVAPGNPLDLRDVSGLRRPDVRLLNREPGSGSRALLDERLAEAGIPGETIPGYETRARGHMAVAQAIASGLADVGVGIRAAARSYGLDLVQLDTERYDLVIPNHFLELPAVGALLDALRNSGVRAQVEALGGYDISVMGREC
jgi:molybdate-binding protein/DNA-binding XRE family transcriptional regulator